MAGPVHWSVGPCFLITEQCILHQLYPLRRTLPLPHNQAVAAGPSMCPPLPPGLIQDAQVGCTEGILILRHLRRAIWVIVMEHGKLFLL